MTDITHPEYEGLLRDIRANRADDGPRLIMADWLEDNGDAVRAEFIRAQVELYALEESVHDRVVSHLSMRSYETPVTGCGCLPCSLRRRERAAWRAKDVDTGGFVIPPVEGKGWGTPEYLFSEIPARDDRKAMLWRRGFPHTVRISVTGWERIGREVMAAQPVCRVEPLGKEPEHVIGCENGASGWTFFVGDAIASRRHIPNAIWRHMRATWFPTREAALDALSEACIAFASTTEGP